jgi:hypothetical protein
MFRRRTDQVYSTLQQVQRRITEQTGASSTPPGEEAKTEALGGPVPQVSLQPLAQALPLNRNAPPPLQAPTYLPNSSKRYVLQLSGDLAMLLMVAWLASMAVMFVLGKNWRASPGAGLAEGKAGERNPPSEPVAATPRRLGDWVLVLLSYPTVSAEYETYFQSRANGLNDIVRRDHTHGWKPYFGVRKPSSGGIQLVFGEVDGQFGVPRDEFLAFATLMAKPDKDGGGNFGSASWVRVEGP